VLFSLLSCTSSAPDAEHIQSELTTIINKQVDAWNSGSIEGFMAYYWHSEDFTFQSGDDRIVGWQTLYERYKKNYAGDKMGRLDFSDIEVKVLTDDLAYVLGRWRVTREDSASQGLFTILFKKLPVGWRIINDHSSSE
jgi:ketosteroid isomerase-like protein